MKIALLTLFGNTNYGNRLQNYAVQKIALRYAESVETLIWDELSMKTKISLKIKKFIWGIEYVDSYDKKKREVFDSFNKEYIFTRKVSRIFNSIPRRINRDYDYFVVGSDQVWNPEIRKSDKEIFFLRFAPMNKRIALSPSVGIDQVSNRDVEWFGKYAMGFPYLSCRERKGCQIIEELTGKKCEQLIDPTLVIDRNEWIEFSQPITVPSKYVLICMLGNINKIVKESINKYCKANNLHIINLFDKTNQYYYASPQNFVYLISKASLVITDSYHACAFSINLRTPFIVLDRCDSINNADNHTISRIYSILQLFHLENHFVNQNSFAIEENDDYEDIDMILFKERVKFINYFEKNLGVM